MAMKTGVKLTIYAYANVQEGRRSEWGHVITPDRRNVPYGDPFQGMQIIARELRKAHRQALQKRKANAG